MRFAGIVMMALAFTLFVLALYNMLHNARPPLL